MKQSLVSKVLEDHNFKILLYDSSALDLAAQKGKLNLLIKVIGNIDGFKSDSANDLKKLAQSIGASPLIIGDYSKAQKLDSDTVYDRYRISTMNLKCFESCLEEAFPEKMKRQGRQIVEISGKIMKSGREQKGFTIRQFADKLGVTKEAVYMYETKKIKPRYSTAKEIEDILETPVIQKQKPFQVPSEVLSKKPASKLDQKLSSYDFDIYDFNKTKFDTLLKDKKNKVIFEQDPKNIEHGKSFSDFFKTLFAFVSDKTKQDILQTDSKKDFIRLLKENK
jgi:predicted transcriptional regulator